MRSIVGIGRELDATPALVLDLACIERRMGEIVGALDGVAIRYPIKANPHHAVLRTVSECGHGFDAASLPEIIAAIDAGGDPSKIVFAAPVKAEAHISDAWRMGVVSFVADTPEEIAKLARCAPGAQVLIRVAVSNDGSVFALTEKFGATVTESVMLVDVACSAGLHPVGATFHVGSQALACNAWAGAIREVTPVLERVAEVGRTTPILDIGGGFPRNYGDEVSSFETIAVTIRDAVRQLPFDVELVVEPGRLLVADAGTVVASVIGVGTHGGERWAYLDAGAYNALFEALAGQGSFHYPIVALDPRLVDAGPATRSWVVAGPSCDSLDRLSGTYDLPNDLAPGDRLLIGRAGAYTNALASAFCGWAPPTVVVARREADAQQGSASALRARSTDTALQEAAS